MSSARSESVFDAYLTPTLFAAVVRGGSIETVRTASFEESASLLVGRAKSAKRCRVWLGGGLCRLWTLAPIAGVEKEAEVSLAIAAALKSRRGLAAPHLVQRSALRAQNGEWLVATVPETLGETLNAIERSGCSVVSVKPWWSWADSARRDRPPPAGAAHLAAFFDGESVTACLSGESVIHADVYAPIDAEGAERLVSRLVAQFSCTGVSRIQLAGVAAPGASTEDAATADFAFARWIRWDEPFTA